MHARCASHFSRLPLLVSRNSHFQSSTFFCFHFNQRIANVVHWNVCIPIYHATENAIVTDEQPIFPGSLGWWQRGEKKKSHSSSMNEVNFSYKEKIAMFRIKIWFPKTLLCMCLGDRYDIVCTYATVYVHSKYIHSTVFVNIVCNTIF